MNVTITGVVWLVVRNGLGQTNYYTTATSIPAGGKTAAVFCVVSGIPAGTYYGTIFATSVSGVAISNSTSFTFTMP